ncbi:MAG: helix-turn-helix domain-containing protein [Butyricicoccus sp.]|nr:helix-turn-helix domain-containing protein [Butyricicoccus sp.]
MYTMYTNRENLPGIKPDTYEFACNPTPTAQKLFFYIDYIGHSFYDKQFAVARTSYCEYLLMYILKGKAVIQTENEKYVASSGQAFLIETAKPHVYGCVEDIECLWVHFGGIGCAELFTHLIQTNRGSHIFTLQNAANFLLQFHTLVDYFKTDTIIPEILISARLHALLALLQISSQPSERTPIDDILHYINQHYYEELTLQNLADRARMSPSRFSAIFKKVTQISPYQYIIQTRLHAAQQYLRDSTLSVEDISYQVGFKNCGTFINAFRQHYNTTPHQFRKGLAPH